MSAMRIALIGADGQLGSDLLRILPNESLTPLYYPAVDSASFGSKARRPAFSVLENKKAKAIGLTNFSEWREALRNYLGKRGLI